MELAKYQKDLITMLKKKGVDKDTTICFVLSLNTNKNLKIMIDWLNKYNDASKDEIFEKWYNIMDIEIPQ